jgi:hypothetical protein
VLIGNFGVLAVLVVGALAEAALALGSLALGLVEVVEPVDPVSALAIAPAALPMRKPAVSTQTPAARRNCVEILVSSHQQAISSVGYRCALSHSFGPFLTRFCGESRALIMGSKPFLHRRAKGSLAVCEYHSPNKICWDRVEPLHFLADAKVLTLPQQKPCLAGRGAPRPRRQ